MCSTQNILELARQLMNKVEEQEEINGIVQEEQYEMEKFSRTGGLDDCTDPDFKRVCVQAVEDGLPKDDSELEAIKIEIEKFFYDYDVHHEYHRLGEKKLYKQFYPDDYEISEDEKELNELFEKLEDFVFPKKESEEGFEPDV